MRRNRYSHALLVGADKLGQRFQIWLSKQELLASFHYWALEMWLVQLRNVFFLFFQLKSLSALNTVKYFWWGASLVAQTVKNPLAMHETQVRFLGQEDSLERGMATHSSILAWRIPWTEEPGGLQSMGLQRAGHNLATKQQQNNFDENSASRLKYIMSIKHVIFWRLIF